MRASIECYGLRSPTSETQAPAAPADPSLAGGTVKPSVTTATPDLVCPAGYGAGSIPSWKQGLQIIEAGDSIGCKLYQEPSVLKRRQGPKGSLTGIPFRRWLFWRSPGGAWQPEAPPMTPQSLGTFGSWELGITSRACFNDFVILVQSASPEASNAGNQGAKLMLNTQ
jgi:hypothetical protein